MTVFTGGIRKLVSAGLRVALVLGAVAVALAAFALVYLRLANAQSDLSQIEWQRLRTRFLERANDPLPVEEAPSTPAAAPEPDAPAAPPSRISIAELGPETLARQQREYQEPRAKNILELQPYRRTSTVAMEGFDSRMKNATLVNINPTINAWYLLTVEWNDGRTTHHHLVNAHPNRQDITLDPDHPNALTFVDTAGPRLCELWSSDGPSPLETAIAASTPYQPLCGEEITLRLPVPGRRTTLEWATDFLRDNVWNGEQITVFVRASFFQDAHLETAEVVTDVGEVEPGPQPEDAPLPPRLGRDYEAAAIAVEDLGLGLEGVRDGNVIAGQWYGTQSQPGVFVSVVRPDLLDPEIFEHHSDVVSRLDEVEREAVVYLVAFDLARFDIGFAVGTEHPRVDWSERVEPTMRNEHLPGPDGIGKIEPLISTGIVPRSLAARSIATFTGGFKRSHGAFRVSELAETNHGTHYGFIESGAVLSKLQPGLSTIYVLEDGTLEMKTWSEADDTVLPRIAFARQNGLPIVEPDPQTGTPRPGRRVSQWAAGNWSGSQDRKFRTVRAGAALQEAGDKRFLIYAYFSSATPSAMARVFEAYSCRYAMLLDMNALEHTYLALYRVESGNLGVQHLVQGMDVLDKQVGEQTLPRFLGFADNRDFFYVLRKGEDDVPSP